MPPEVSPQETRAVRPASRNAGLGTRMHVYALSGRSMVCCRCSAADKRERLLPVKGPPPAE
jgi:hypothetical protein